MLSEEPTPRELERRLDKIDTSIERGFEQINGRLDQMVSTEVFQMYKQGADHRISELEKNQEDTARRAGGLEQSRATRDELEQMRSRQESRSRWAIGTSLTAIGLMLTAFGAAVGLMRLWTGV